MCKALSQPLVVVNDQQRMCERLEHGKLISIRFCSSTTAS
jgi:hypothetical protein